MNDLFKGDLINCDVSKDDSVNFDEIKEILDQVDDCNEEININTLLENINELSCNVCSERFRLQEDLETHKISHPKDGQPICTKCNKKFNDLKVLKRHVRIHMKAKPFPCNLCNKSFSGLYIISNNNNFQQYSLLNMN